MPRSLGFRTTRSLVKHFNKHRDEFGVTTVDEYSLAATAFIERKMADGDSHCITSCHHDRSQFDYVRYNRNTNEFAILAFDGYIRTYMVVCRHSKSNPEGHRLSSNREYYERLNDGGACDDA